MSVAQTQGATVLAVDVLVQMRASSFEPLFTYRLDDDGDIGVGTVVRVPLGRREQYGYVVSRPRLVAEDPKLRALERVPNTPQAFDEEILRLAHWLVQAYCCSLSEAISTVVFVQSLPRTVDRIIPANRDLALDRAGVPARLVDFLFDEVPDGIAIEELLRHPEARRAADRPALRKALTRLVALGAVHRERVRVGPPVKELLERRLYLVSGAQATGKKLQGLVAMLTQTDGITVDSAKEAGFSREIIRRAVSLGVVREEFQPLHQRSANAAPLVAAGTSSGLIPTAEQHVAIAEIHGLLSDTPQFAEVLLHGVTGSGKTLVYIEAVRKVIAAGDSAIILVPEIALTPQTAKRFTAAFGDTVVVFHSGLGQRERFEAWRAAQDGRIRVVVGARSAVFAPLPRLRLLIIDEVHETTYRHEQTPRYHAVAVARERMSMNNGVVVYGSATPPLELYARAKLGHMKLLTLSERATKIALPKIEIIDLAQQARGGNARMFSPRLITALDQRLLRGEKAVLFVNRRGTARFVLCRPCGFVPTCKRCSLSLTYHRGDALLRCHLCDAQEPMPERCPRCHAGALSPLGLGTEKIASELAELFPKATIIRMDSDTTTKVGDHARLLNHFERDGDILVGTQMIAKGLDFPTVTLAAVVAADVGLHVADYRASERTFALLTQVAGRSGRTTPGEALIQTYLPEHPAIVHAAAHDYEGFARIELAERRLLHYPPFVRLAYITLIGREREQVQEVAANCAVRLRKLAPSLDVLGPAFSTVPRINNEWRMRIAVKAARLEAFRNHLREEIIPWLHRERGVRFTLDIDM